MHPNLPLNTHIPPEPIIWSEQQIRDYFADDFDLGIVAISKETFYKAVSAKRKAEKAKRAKKPKVIQHPLLILWQVVY